MTGLTTLEEQVLEMLLRGNDQVLDVLRQQVKDAQVSSREMTGVGFFTSLKFPPKRRASKLAQSSSWAT
jgi:hypothetical protein